MDIECLPISPNPMVRVRVGVRVCVRVGIGVRVMVGIRVRVTIGIGIGVEVGVRVRVIRHDTLKTSVTILFTLGELGLGEMRQNRISRAVGPKAFK